MREKRDAVERSDSGTNSSNDQPETSKNFPQSLTNLNLQENPRKRKRANAQGPLSRWKRLRAHYNDKYRELYNETVNELIHVPPIHRKQLILPSQIGVTPWSSQEKEIFFNTLAKKGRGDLPGIASAIETKNELEVHVYLKLLQNAVVHQHLHSRRNQLFDVSAAPAALEVSSACSAALELSADALCILHQRAEAKFERKKHRDMWLLNQKLGRWASLCLSQGARGEKTIRECLPAAELLDLENFLKLSENIFMNSNKKDENWREYCSGSEKPSMSFTAFGDFHRLVLSITRRLMQSSLFFAMSRRKASTASNYTPKQAVRKQDIAAALNVLGMKHNSHKFWTRVAKRCSLSVYDDERQVKDVLDAPLSLSEVDRRLTRGRIHDEDEDESEALDTNDTECSISSTSPFEDDLDISSKTSSRSDGWTSPAGSGCSSNSLQDSNKDLDIYAEAIDAKASLNEEKRLWELLAMEPPEPLNTDGIFVPRVPTGKRKTGDDLDDWRAWTNYAPEWETYPDMIPEASFTSSCGSSERKGKEKEDQRPRMLQ